MLDDSSIIRWMIELQFNVFTTAISCVIASSKVVWCVPFFDGKNFDFQSFCHRSSVIDHFCRVSLLPES